jgi:hypothetical protein
MLHATIISLKRIHWLIFNRSLLFSGRYELKLWRINLSWKVKVFTPTHGRWRLAFTTKAGRSYVHLGRFLEALTSFLLTCLALKASFECNRLNQVRKIIVQVELYKLNWTIHQIHFKPVQRMEEHFA